MVVMMGAVAYGGYRYHESQNSEDFYPEYDYGTYQERFATEMGPRGNSVLKEADKELL